MWARRVEEREERREKKRKRNGGKGGIYTFPVAEGKRGNCGGRRVLTQKGRHLIGEVRGYFTGLGRRTCVYMKDHDIRLNLNKFKQSQERSH